MSFNHIHQFLPVSFDTRRVRQGKCYLPVIAVRNIRRFFYRLFRLFVIP